MDEWFDILGPDDTDEHELQLDPDASRRRPLPRSDSGTSGDSLAVWQRIEAYHEKLAIRRLLRDELD